MSKMDRVSVFLSTSTGLGCEQCNTCLLLAAVVCRYVEDEYNTAPAMAAMPIPTSHPAALLQPPAILAFDVVPWVAASSVCVFDDNVCSLLSVDTTVLALYTASFAAASSVFSASSFR